MSPLQIVLVIIIVLIVVTAFLTYFVRNKYYSQIDELDQEKNGVLKQAPYDELKEVSELNITGQSNELRKKLENQWQDIEAVKYPKLENHLFDAEQATDRYRLGESKKYQDSAKQALEDINIEIADLQSSLKELLEREQANLEKIDAIKKRYHEVRKSLLAYSFSFGPASESFERNLSLMEEDFAEFSEYTVSGDHEEANEIVRRLNENITEAEKQMEEIPPLLKRINEDYSEQLKDLQAGYQEMTENGYIFPDDTILEDINHLENDKEKIFDSIRLLDLEEAAEQAEKLAASIDEQYERMEEEVEAKPKVLDLIADSKQAIYYLQEENHRLAGMGNRLEQSYVLLHNEPAIIGRLQEQIKANREEYEQLNTQISMQQKSYSVVHTELGQLFEQLNNLYNEHQRVAKYLDSYREEELKFRNGMLEMEQAMYEMKRALENERLPGLPNNYLELFFSTSTRIEKLSAELSRSKIQLTEIQKNYQMCEEDISQLGDLTEEIIQQVELIERVSQRLYRYKDTHKGVLETIRYSESLFVTDHDYDTSLRLLREKLENVDAGTYDKIVEEYENERN